MPTDVVTLQNAVQANANGDILGLRSSHDMAIQITGTFSATINFEGTIDDSTWVAVGLKTAGDGAAVTSATGAGIWKLPNDGPALSGFRARVSSYASGSVTVKAIRRRNV